jgi:hypothetical protein
VCRFASLRSQVMVWDVTVRRTVQPEVVSSFQASGGVKKVAGTGSVVASTWNASLPGEYEILCMCVDSFNSDETAHTFATAGNETTIKVALRQFDDGVVA